MHCTAARAAGKGDVGSPRKTRLAEREERAVDVGRLDHPGARVLALLEPLASGEVDEGALPVARTHRGAGGIELRGATSRRNKGASGVSRPADETGLQPCWRVTGGTLQRCRRTSETSRKAVQMEWERELSLLSS